tara:strand:+ start:435 stop:1931 length:1497 start_codon:yes stop_codon:yes gene_type:complete
MHHCLIFSISSDNIIRGFGSYKIAHHLRKENWDVEVIDYTCSWKLEELKEFVNSRVNSGTKFIGFGKVFTYWTETLEAFTKWIKETYPNLYIISGMQQFPTYDANYIDYFIIGHGENALTALLSQLFSNGELVPQTQFPWTDKKVILANTVESKFHAGYTTDLEVQYQDRDFIREGEWLTMEFSRGCKFKCKFCDFPYLSAKGNYILTKETFVKNMRENYDRFGVKNYIVADSTFNETTEKIRTYAEGVQELNFAPFFAGFMRADLLISRPEDKEHLLKMGFLAHAYGIETLNHESGKSIGKGMHPDKIKQGLYDIYNYFNNNERELYAASLSFIIGLPYETKQTIKDTIKWVNNLPPEVYVSIHPLIINKVVYGNSSEFALDWKKYGYVDQTTYSDEPYKKSANRDESREIVNWKNDHMTMGDAQELCKKAYAQITKDNWLDIWMLASNSMHGMSVEERLNTPATPGAHNDSSCPKGQAITNKFVRNYIEKKLSWSH